jgi:hypothetical protein
MRRIIVLDVRDCPGRNAHCIAPRRHMCGIYHHRIDTCGRQCTGFVRLLSLRHGSVACCAVLDVKIHVSMACADLLEL